DRPSGRFRQGDARWARQCRRAGRRQPLGRPASAAGDRTGTGRPAGDLRVRRLLLGTRPRHRRSPAGGAGAAHRRRGGVDRGPARLDDPQRRPDPRPRGRGGGRPRHPRRPARDVPDLRRDRRLPARPGGRRLMSERDDDRTLLATAGTQARRVAFGPGGGAAMPAERSEQFFPTLRRLGEILGPETRRLVVVLMLAVGAGALAAFGPRLLGQATDLVVSGVGSDDGIDFGALNATLLRAVGLYLAAWALSAAQANLLAGIVQRSMYALRESVEDKLHRLPLGYVDRQHRGDLLSRVRSE